MEQSKNMQSLRICPLLPKTMAMFKVQWLLIQSSPQYHTDISCEQSLPGTT